MERAHLSAAQGKERLQLIAARERMHLSLEEVAQRLDVSKTTVYRWEKKGDIPQPLHLRGLCKLYGATAKELGFDERYTVDVQTINDAENEEEECIQTFRQQNLILRLMSIVWNYPLNDARYQKLQSLVTLELEDNSMNDEISRRDALRFLALFPAEMFGLSQFQAGFKRGVSHEDILKHCAAGIVACWQLRKGKELAFADVAVSKYIPTLKALAQTALIPQRTAAADLLAQCFLLKSTLSRAITGTSNEAIPYAQQAETYGQQAGNLTLRILALRTQAIGHCHANQWLQALQVTERAKYLLEGRDKQDKQKHPLASSQPAEEPIPQLVHSYVYAGLATYQAYHGRKEDALHALKKAHYRFFEHPANEETPIWIDHNVGNLLLNDGETYMHLGLYKDALDSLGQVDTQYAQDMTIPWYDRIGATFDQVMAEVSRDDQPRDMLWCIDHWLRGVEEAKAVQSQKYLNVAVQVYGTMWSAWPGEKRIKNLREYIVH